MDGTPNRGKKAAFSHFSGVGTEPKSSLYFIFFKRVWTVKEASVSLSG